ncbi:hypothetical protein A3762_11855 [Oleiphilus sp. HI0125]|uniref:substrate-binding periplasmic protein n=2 Tax=Oleiphilus sp. HI0125 TaxID=1822266 RepID=UPI0007C22394|nr:ABC transporter substrate-binding protein [Oleiphilus sp. HI0125]KZZ55666.1 hypothetical protein A3762_11855 [Oleiphilus sp. HI0125]
MLAKNASIDGTFVWSKKDERFADFLYSDTVITDVPVVFYQKDAPIPWEAENWESLKDIKVGATIGYTYLSNFRKYETEGLIQVERSETDSLNFKKLLRGRIGAFPASLNTGYGLLQSEFTQEEIDQLTYTPQMRPSYQPTTFHLLISKLTPDAESIMSAFNKGLTKLRKSGYYEKFLKQSRNGFYEVSD